MNQVIVVEGKNDYSKIKEVYKDAVIVTTIKKYIKML